MRRATSGEEEAGALIAVKAVGDALGMVQHELRERVQDGMRPGDRRVAYATIDGDEVEIGQVTLTRPKKSRPTAQVVDEQALLAWCKQVHPEAIRVQESVAEHVVADLLRAAVAGDAEFPDPETGEMLQCPPGVAVVEARPGRPVLQVRLADASRDYANSLLEGMVFSGTIGPSEAAEPKEIGQ